MILLIKNFVTNFCQTLVSLARITIWTKCVNKIKISENTKKSGIVILANGPSLNEMIADNSSFLKGKSVICVNSFPTSDYFTSLKPDYFIISAPDYWLKIVRPELSKMRNDLIEKLLLVDWDLKIFIPTQAKHCTLWNELLQKNKHLTFHHYNLTPIYGFRCFRNFCYKRNIGMPRPHNVLIPALMMSIKMKFADIYLWGADHSWLPLIYVDQENKVLLTHQHFYDKDTAIPLTMQKNVKEDRKLHEMLYKFVYTFEGYFFIREFAEKSRSNIWNCTPGSFIDAFERLKI